MIILKSKITHVIYLITILAVISCFCVNNVFAQMPQEGFQQELRTDFSDDELEIFAEVAPDISMVQQQGQQDMVSGIEEEGISVEDFNDIFNQMHDPQSEVQASEEDKVAFDNAMQVLGGIQQETEQRITNILEDAGMAPQVYNEIMTAYQQNPEVQQRVNEILQQ